LKFIKEKIHKLDDKEDLLARAIAFMSGFKDDAKLK
jgi:hypothetical protein